MELFLSRAEYDRLIDINRWLSCYLFETFERKWNVRGITFFDVPSAVVDEVNESLRVG